MADVNELETGFHAQDGWYFKRMPDGTVRIVTPAGTGNSDQYGSRYALFVDPGTWASIVASVSASSETGTTHGEALAFHMGGRYPHTVETAEAAYDHLKARIDRGPTPESEGC